MYFCVIKTNISIKRMKDYYQRPEACEEANLPDLDFMIAASGTIQDYEEIPDTWN